MAGRKFTQNDNNLAIAYYRFSSHAQNEASIDQQRDAAHRYAEAHGYQIIREFEDAAISGTTDKRPGYQQMLSDVSKLKPAVLILWKTDRLGRDKYELVIAKKRIRDAGCQIVYVAETLPENSKEAVLMESLYDGLAEYFSLNLGENVSRGMRSGAEQAHALGKRVLGYRTGADKRYEVDPATAPIVRRIFEDYARGKTMRTIADELNAEGFRTVRGNDFTINGLRTILSNDSYIGIYRHSGIVIEGGMPALVSKDLFEKAQAQLALNKRRGAQLARGLNDDETPRYWLTGKLFCGECSTGMNGHSGRSRNGRKFYYYGCPEHRKGACPKSSVRKEAVEGLVLDALSEILDETDNVSSLAVDAAAYYEESLRDESYIKGIEAQIKEHDKAIGNLVRRIEEGLDSEAVLEALTARESDRKALVETLEAERAKQRLLDSEHDIKAHFRRFWHANLDDLAIRKQVLDYFIDRIYLYDDRLVITGFFFNGDKPPGEREYLFKRLKDGSLRFESFAFGPTRKQQVIGLAGDLFSCRCTKKATKIWCGGHKHPNLAGKT